MNNYNQIARWSDTLLAKGRYGFALSELRTNFPELSGIAVKHALRRLTDKKKIQPLFKGYYLIIPPQFTSQGIIPPHLFLDAFMKSLNRNYYVGLLSAAAFHEASHQQPQEYFVLTTFPALRPTTKRGLKINYISIRKIPENLLEQRKTEAGYLKISNAALTACDLVHFEKRIGGLNRAATVINELAESIKPTDFSTHLLRHVAVASLQRLGYLLEHVCAYNIQADALFESMKKENLNFFRVALKTGKTTKGFSSNNRWKVIVNTKIDIDE
ncbi:type IV toxin-antitoxin system AbiEi family antitoxin domain-containing protein [Thermaurantimonas aggregans]|uniref:type IV toxin-antitoxin system AbiEi family antitoxin domain-containing protein n=1 Tax=Thermaurantimonas aggregans TaxID=2173829 RepID=UPI0023F441B9|nr:type IV toxin-antitoxin system AbiEi family antitoxin [Thermaurantimonas aggregans]MCS6974000.1 type IV toxin-antitoxin system AbiEi family antitoxin [Cyclobacteriaceae bacterium]MCX8149858.1 type IV toxin-antitoxin system AbiEi family antitoxin [Thermaurantimonas aggregans]MDW8331081.1 type IV toxin-antitoxin system AbiEi family antitoxin [Cyclobacteriaceae bacterium]